MDDKVASRRSEFDKHVWDHSTDPNQMTFDQAKPLEGYQYIYISQLVTALSNSEDDHALASLLKTQSLARHGYIVRVAQLIGLTRTKPQTDLKPALKAAGLPAPALERFAYNDRVWELAGNYLIPRFRKVFTSLVSVDGDELIACLDALNTATWPGYVRQERAKKSGGYAEQGMAIFLNSLGIKFEPRRKIDTGLTADAHVSGESFDLVVPDERTPLLCIISMAHSSNIGQYGESKANDVRSAKSAIESLVPQPKLGVFADGAGFYSNAAGLNTILSEADEVFQYKTIWKLGVCAAGILGYTTQLVLPDAEHHLDFLDRYSASVEILSNAESVPGWVSGGEALIRVVDVE